MIEEAELTKIVAKYHKTWGYAVDMPTLETHWRDGKTFPPCYEPTPSGVIEMVDEY